MLDNYGYIDILIPVVAATFLIIAPHRMVKSTHSQYHRKTLRLKKTGYVILGAVAIYVIWQLFMM
jgi:ABC-type nickel/cobalt efflux system permease component RcnA